MSRKAARTEAKPGCYSSAGFAGSHGFQCVSVRDMPLMMPNVGILVSICAQGPTSGGGMALSQRLYKLQGLTVCGEGEAASIVVDAAS